MIAVIFGACVCVFLFNQIRLLEWILYRKLGTSAVMPKRLEEDLAVACEAPLLNDRARLTKKRVLDR